MDIDKNKYPAFWFILQRKNKFSKSVMFTEESKQKRKTKIEKNVNPELNCPMNFLFDYQFDRVGKLYDEIPMSEFFVKYPLDISRRKFTKIEEFIQKYAIELSKYFSKTDENLTMEMLEIDFEDLIEEIKKINISNKYLGLMSWLIDRALMITPQMKSNKKNCDSQLWRNRSVLLKVLYTINPSALLKCFSGKSCETEQNSTYEKTA